MTFSFSTILFAFTLTLLAGLATGIGGLIAFFTHHTNRSFLSGSLGFSAGVMIYVSFVEMLDKSREMLAETQGPVAGAWMTVSGFFLGMLVIGLIDRLIPSAENPHELYSLEEMQRDDPQRSAALQARQSKKLMRMGLFTALAIAIHNFPEGMVTMMSALYNPGLGVAIAIAIAIHNIPEGIAVSVPVYYATGSRRKALWYSFLSGLAEPLGAIIGVGLLYAFLTPTLLGLMFAAVAGVMVFISLDELLPGAEEYGHHECAIWWMVIGMGVMALSLLLLESTGNASA